MTAESPLSVSSKMIQYWEWWLTDQMGVLPLRGMWTVWRNGPTPTFAVQQRKMQSPAAQEHRLGANGQKGSRKSRERPEIPCGHQVDHEPPKHLCSKQGQQNLGGNGKTTASKARGGNPSPLLRDCETNLECWDKCFPPQYNRDRDILV